MKKKKHPAYRYERNGRITDFNDLFELANNRETVIWSRWGPREDVRPAAFFLNWSLAQLKNAQLYKVKKIAIIETI